MKVLVFGAGAIGSVFGGFLSGENDVTLIGRGAHIERIAQDGLRVSGIWGEHRFNRLQAYAAVDEIPGGPDFDLIMITTKSYDTESAVEAVKPLLGEGTLVMSMQNGIGNEDTIASIVGDGRTMGGMAIFGAHISAPGHVEVTVYASEVLVGCLKPAALSKKAGEIALIFSQAGIPAKPSDDILRDKWMKAFYNIALNPLSAILRVPYGVLGEHVETRRIMETLLKEAFAVALAKEIPLKFTMTEYLDHLIEKQLPPTASHKSSMLQDIERGKKTEVDYLNGAIVEIGREMGVPTPVNETISDLIRALEKGG